MLPSPDPGLLQVIVAGFGVLTLGSVVRLVALRGAPDQVRTARLGSLKTWWVVALLVSAVAVGGRIVAATVFTVVTAVGFREYLDLCRDAGWPDRGFLAGLVLAGGGYFCLAMGWTGAFTVFVPLAGLLWASLRIFLYRTRVGGVAGSARWLWGLLLVGYGVGHAAALFTLPETGAAGGGWFLFLVLLVETEDIFQALVGRAVGRRPLAPGISPGKTWEGYLGGLVLTPAAAAAVGPVITPLDLPGSLAAGLLISTVGVVGDLTISVVKREAGARDSGTLLPGQGGVLDRIDSLIFTAPLFYYVALFVV